MAKAWNVLFQDQNVVEIDTADERLVELFAYLRPDFTIDEQKQMINWLDTDGDGVINRSEWILIKDFESF